MIRLLSITIIVIITFMSRYRGIGLQGKDEESMMQGLIKELLKVWSNKAVQDRYQNYFLIYLDTLSERDAQMAITKEIKLTLQNKSHFFKINRAMQSHRSIVSKLQRFIDEINSNNKNSVIIDVAKFSSVLEQLRNNNLEVAQAVLCFNYECLGSGKHPLQLIIGNNYLFEQLNVDNEILKKSFLDDYIAFSNSYDPFLLYHYENSKKIVPAKAQNVEIQQLFNLSVSKAYKFMKAQQEILQFLSGKIPTKFIYGKTKRTHYNLIEEFSSPESTNYKSNVFKLQNNAYIKRYELNQQDNGYIQRTKTEQSPIKGIIFNTKNAKKTLGTIYNRHQLPKIQHIKKADITPVDSPAYNYHRAQVRKLSEQEPTNKYTFKIRRKTSFRNNQSSTIFAQRPRGYLQSINRIMRRQEEFLKLSEHSRRDISDKQGGQSLYMKLNQTQNLYPSQYEEDQQRQPPLSNKHNQQLLNLKAQPQPIEEKEPKVESKPEYIIAPPKSYKNFKLKAGNMKVSNIFIFLKELNIKPYYRSMFQVQNWEHLLKNNQYYFHKFYIDDVLQAISLCCGLPDSNILIKYWAPLQTCDKQMSSFLFKKYLQHIQRNSICTAIYYSLGQIPELVDNGFVKYNQKILAKYRSIPQQVDSFNYFPFLSLNFSIVAVPKSVAKQDLENITIKENKVAPFNQKEFICFNYLLITNKIINLASGFSAFGTYTPNIKNFKDVGTKLIKEEIFENGYNTQLKIPSSNLLTLRLRHPVHSPFFVANHPIVKFIGEEVYSDSQSLVASLQLVKNTKLYFGKGFKSINSMMTVIKNRAPSKKKIEYCVNMFRKCMRGRLLSTNLRDEYCFGDFQVVFQWIDFLKGKVQQDLKEFELFGQTSFNCIIQIQNQYIMGFEIRPNSFL